jgi:hypothetical protein
MVRYAKSLKHLLAKMFELSLLSFRQQSADFRPNVRKEVLQKLANFANFCQCTGSSAAPPMSETRRRNVSCEARGLLFAEVRLAAFLSVIPGGNLLDLAPAYHAMAWVPATRRVKLLVGPTEKIARPAGEKIGIRGAAWRWVQHGNNQKQIPSGNDRKKSKSPLPSWRTTDHGRKPAPGKGSLLGWGGMTKDPCISFFSGRHS